MDIGMQAESRFVRQLMVGDYGMAHAKALHSFLTCITNSAEMLTAALLHILTPSFFFSSEWQEKFLINSTM